MCANLRPVRGKRCSKTVKDRRLDNDTAHIYYSYAVLEKLTVCCVSLAGISR